MKSMQHRNRTIALGVMMALLTVPIFAQQNIDEARVPGDNFSLSGALDLFKESESPEAFERKLNDESNKVNNLDLNGDHKIDYLRVIDKQEGDVHAFILQVLVSETESQDVAVIEVEKEGSQNATVQIVGDEDLYGEETIVEPNETVKTHAGTQTSTTVVNVYTWPAVRYVYTPAYRVWVSPWSWRARPVWWHPWKPIHYHAYYGYHRHHPHYVVVHDHRTVHAHRIYRPVRTTSVIVRTRHREPIERYRTTPPQRTTHPRAEQVKSAEKQMKPVEKKETVNKRSPRKRAASAGGASQKVKSQKHATREG
jgi:hypothetical protein